MRSLDADTRAILDDLGPFDELRVNNHWVPVVYLSAFTDTRTSDGRLYLFDRERLDAPPPQPAPDAVVKQRGLYLTDYVDGRARDTLERYFARHIEGPFGRIRNKLVFGPEVGVYPRLTVRERVHLAVFIAMQQGRTPAMRDQIEWLASFHHTFDLRARLQDERAFRAKHRERTGEDLSPATVRKLRRDLDSGRLEIRPGGSDTWLTTFLNTAMNVAEEISDLPWRVVRAPPDVHFPVSDMPVVVSRRVPGDLNYRLGGGWRESICEAIFPLSSEVVLVIGPSVEDDPLVGSLQWHKSVRERIIAHSNRFVLDHHLEPDIPDVLRRTSPPHPVLEFGGEQYSVTEPVGPVVRRVFEGREELLRFGPRREE